MHRHPNDHTRNKTDEGDDSTSSWPLTGSRGLRHPSRHSPVVVAMMGAIVRGFGNCNDTHSDRVGSLTHRFHDPLCQALDLELGSVTGIYIGMTHQPFNRSSFPLIAIETRYGSMVHT